MIKVVYDIKVYRQVLRDIIKKDDVVVELGCHVGNSTRIIDDLSTDGQIMPLDNSPESVSAMKSVTEEYPGVEFIKADVRLHETLEEVARKIKRLVDAMFCLLIWVVVTILTQHSRYFLYGHQL